MKRLIIYLAIGVVLLGLIWLLPHSLFSAEMEVPGATQPASTETAIATTPAAAIPTESTCPVPADGTKLLTSTQKGYCLLYLADYAATLPPDDYAAISPDNIVINPQAAMSDTLGEAWASIRIDNAAGRAVAQIADEQIAAVGPGFNITRIEMMVAGEPAIMVDGLPGQDSTRKLFIVHNQHLYTLDFAPWYPNVTDPTPLEKLYRMIVDTLHFLT